MRPPAMAVLIAAGVLLAGCGAPPSGPPAPVSPAPETPTAVQPGSTPPAPVPPAPAVSAPPASTAPGAPRTAAAGSGALPFLHATVVTVSGKRYRGVLRWGEEEAFWDDRLHGQKADLPYADRQPEEDRPHFQVRFVGFLPIGFDEGESGRQFAARFGDIVEIRPFEGDKAEVAMKNGTKVRLDGGSNDIGAILHVDDPVSGGIDLSWNSVERIVFEPAPARGPEPKATRLFGDVATSAGSFTGFIQWDGQECLSSDKLDGYSVDGKVSLEMGSLRVIEKHDPFTVRVETNDGRKIQLQGTNDVNGSIRGIYVEDERYGRVRVSWDAFRRVDFRTAAATGRRYEDYPPARSLQGTVTDRDGKRWPGKIVFDLDESETWEMLDGERQGILYSVPFERVRTIEPLRDMTTQVTLRSGERLPLGETQDVNAKNAGVLVLSGASPPADPPGAEAGHYVPWKLVARIDLD